MARHVDMNSDRILTARLHAVALRHASHGTADTDEALAELRSITTRPDLLGRVGGMFKGGDDPWVERAEAAVRLVLRAGADPEVLEGHAAHVRKHKRDHVPGLQQ